MINDLCTLKTNKILPFSGNRINLGETNNTTTYVRINSFYRKQVFENYTGNNASGYYIYYTHTISSRFTNISDSLS